MLPPKAMKVAAAKKAMKSGKATAAKTMTASMAYRTMAESTGLKAKTVKGAVEAYVNLAAKQLKTTGAFKFGGALNMKLKSKPATPARKGVNPFTKEPCVFKAKPASKTVKVFSLKKFNVLVN